MLNWRARRYQACHGGDRLKCEKVKTQRSNWADAQVKYDSMLGQAKGQRGPGARVHHKFAEPGWRLGCLYCVAAAARIHLTVCSLEHLCIRGARFVWLQILQKTCFLPWLALLLTDSGLFQTPAGVHLQAEHVQRSSSELWDDMRA